MPTSPAPSALADRLSSPSRARCRTFRASGRQSEVDVFRPGILWIAEDLRFHSRPAAGCSHRHDLTHQRSIAAPVRGHQLQELFFCFRAMWAAFPNCVGPVLGKEVTGRFDQSGRPGREGVSILSHVPLTTTTQIIARRYCDDPWSYPACRVQPSLSGSLPAKRDSCAACPTNCTGHD